jgi:hypothetical protein
MRKPIPTAQYAAVLTALKHLLQDVKIIPGWGGWDSGALAESVLAKYDNRDDEDLDAEDSKRKRYIKRARENYGHEGETEIDDNAELSTGEGGAYVQAWVWVAESDLQ